jgi:hypothetical protein
MQPVKKCDYSSRIPIEYHPVIGKVGSCVVDCLSRRTIPREALDPGWARSSDYLPAAGLAGAGLGMEMVR